MSKKTGIKDPFYLAVAGILVGSAIGWNLAPHIDIQYYSDPYVISDHSACYERYIDMDGNIVYYMPSELRDICLG